MIVIYHNRDLDGWMSAAIVKLRFPEINLIGWDYGQPYPEISPYLHYDNTVIMVDISFTKEKMLDLYNSHNLIWIDHHASAIKYVEGITDGRIKGARDINYAACELTWQYFFSLKPIPEAVRLLGRYDCFGHKGTEEEQKVLEFQYAARSIASNPEEAAIFIGMTEYDVVLTLNAGKSIYKYLCTEAKQIYARRINMVYADLKIAMINVDRFNPVNFGINYHADGYDIAGCFWFADDRWIFSLYNDNGKVDVSEICKKEGGGGHKGAAGFTKGNINWLYQYCIFDEK